MGARLTDCPTECPFAYLDSSLGFLPFDKTWLVWWSLRCGPLWTCWLKVYPPTHKAVVQIIDFKKKKKEFRITQLFVAFFYDPGLLHGWLSWVPLLSVVGSSVSPFSTCPPVKSPSPALTEFVLLGELFRTERRKGYGVSVGWQEPPTASYVSFDVKLDTHS